MSIIAAADGSALGNPGPAGWAWYVDDQHWAAGGWPHGTNNMGELMAVLDLLNATAHLDDDLLVYCDSVYVINSVTKWMPGWKRKGWRKGDGKPVQNVELMQSLDSALQGRTVKFEWVKGHSGHPLNEAADERANAAATAFRDGVQPDAGPRWAGDGAESPDPVARGEESEQADLFSVLDDIGEPSAEDEVVALERELLTDECRSDPAAMAALLHPDWHEIGRSGRVWSRADALAELGPLPTPVDLEVVQASRPQPDQVLLVWRAWGVDGATMRSSLWVRYGNRWRQYFHQGTPEL